MKGLEILSSGRSLTRVHSFWHCRYWHSLASARFALSLQSVVGVPASLVFPLSSGCHRVVIGETGDLCLRPYVSQQDD